MVFFFNRGAIIFFFIGICCFQLVSVFSRRKGLDGNQTPTNIISPKKNNRNLEMTILFSIVERSNNYIIADDNPDNPQSKGFKLQSEDI